MRVHVVNCGSSTLKFQLIDPLHREMLLLLQSTA
jgi:acetate kinase